MHSLTGLVSFVKVKLQFFFRKKIRALYFQLLKDPQRDNELKQAHLLTLYISSLKFGSSSGVGE